MWTFSTQVRYQLAASGAAFTQTMSRTTLICNVCGATAKVVSANPRFESKMYGPGAGGRFKQVLQETHYVIECPKCGRRGQVVKADTNGRN
jgi:Zn finger protein HypA/HybF involved in hydrogenase expression